MFTAGDVALVVHFGHFLLENVCGAYSVDAPLSILKTSLSDALPTSEPASNSYTLVFMPHCPKELYANLLLANWTPSSLSRLIIIGNSFTGITEAICSGAEKQRLKRIYEAAGLMSERELPAYDDKTIFNATSVHTFDNLHLKSQHEDLWMVPTTEREALKASFQTQERKDT